MKGMSIVIGMGRKPEDDGSEDVRSPMQDIKDQAAKEVISAVKAGNTKLLAQALESFYQACYEEGIDPSAADRNEGPQDEVSDE